MKPSPVPKPIFANNLKNVIYLFLHNILTILCRNQSHTDQYVRLT